MSLSLLNNQIKQGICDLNKQHQVQVIELLQALMSGLLAVFGHSYQQGNAEL